MSYEYMYTWMNWCINIKAVCSVWKLKGRFGLTLKLLQATVFTSVKVCLTIREDY